MAYVVVLFEGLVGLLNCVHRVMREYTPCLLRFFLQGGIMPIACGRILWRSVFNVAVCGQRCPAARHMKNRVR